LSYGQKSGFRRQCLLAGRCARHCVDAEAGSYPPRRLLLEEALRFCSAGVDAVI